MTQTSSRPAVQDRRDRPLPYDVWIESIGIPIHRGYFIEDARTIEVAPWPERGCNAAFIQMVGQQGVAEARITEIPPGGTTTAMKFALDEAVYVLEGQGLTTVWADGVPKKTFEWGPRSLFLLPRGTYRQFSNTRGDRPARLVHNNHLPVAMSVNPDPDFYFNNAYESPRLLEAKEGELYSVAQKASGAGRGATWFGNFFTDLAAWDQMVPHRQRGGGGHVVDISFPNSELGGHMSIFPTGTYKKGHQHGPGVVIIIPAGGGYSIMWPEGGEKVIVPWREASMFVPPNQWFHQHFNTSVTPARYLALSPIRQLSGTMGEDRALVQIEYPEEESWIKEKYVEEVEKNGLKSLMPDEIYKNRDYVWGYEAGEETGARLVGT
jgi:hypothetical protein